MAWCKLQCLRSRVTLTSLPLPGVGLSHIVTSLNCRDLKGFKGLIFKPSLPQSSIDMYIGQTGPHNQG